MMTDDRIAELRQWNPTNPIVNEMLDEIERLRDVEAGNRHVREAVLGNISSALDAAGAPTHRDIGGKLPKPLTHTERVDWLGAELQRLDDEDH